MCTYLLRNLLLLLLLTAACLYLGFLHVTGVFQDEFSCSIKTGLLQDEPQIPDLIPCKLVFFSVFQIISILTGGVYILLMPVVIYNVLQLCQWDKRLLSIYEMLPAFDLLSRKMLTCPINDLNIILLFLQANISEVKSFSRLSAVCTLRETTSNKQHIDTVVDFMTLLAGLEISKPKYQACTGEADGDAPLTQNKVLGKSHCSDWRASSFPPCCFKSVAKGKDGDVCGWPMTTKHQGTGNVLSFLSRVLELREAQVLLATSAMAVCKRLHDFLWEKLSYS